MDWDYAASGLWRVLTADEREGRAPIEPWRPWSEMLTPALLDELRRWIVRGEGRDRRSPDVSDRDERFWTDALAVAERVQEELGEEHEVLCATGSGAWRWVRRPVRWS